MLNESSELSELRELFNRFEKSNDFGEKKECLSDGLGRFVEIVEDPSSPPREIKVATNIVRTHYKKIAKEAKSWMEDEETESSFGEIVAKMMQHVFPLIVFLEQFEELGLKYAEILGIESEHLRKLRDNYGEKLKRAMLADEQDQPFYSW